MIFYLRENIIRKTLDDKLRDIRLCDAIRYIHYTMQQHNLLYICAYTTDTLPSV